MKILILRVSAIGDVIHTLPAIFLIKKTIPNAQISWVVQTKAATLLGNQPFLANLWILPDKFWRPKNWGKTFAILKELRKTNWDIILDFQGIHKTSLLLMFLRGTKYGFDKASVRAPITTWATNKRIDPEYTNIIQKNLALTSFAIHDKTQNTTCPTIDVLKKNFYLEIPEPSKLAVNFWLKRFDLKNIIVLAPNTTWPSKHWPEENWAKLIKNLSAKLIQDYPDHFIVLLGKDFGAAANNLSRFIDKERFLNVFCAPKWDLITTSCLISRTKVLVAPDTGLLHLADFLATKTIGIFGPTNKDKHGPFLIQQNILNAIQVDCRHFYKKNHGKNQNPTNNDDCMYKLTYEGVQEKILKILGD